MRIVPAETSSSPAISRRSVDFPQPEGPTNTTNSPSSISRSRGGITSTSANRLATFSSVMRPMRRSLFHRAEGQAADKLLLAEPAHDQDRRDRHGRGGAELGVEKPLGARIAGDEGGERRGLRRRQVQRPEGLVPGEDDVEKERRGDPG